MQCEKHGCVLQSSPSIVHGLGGTLLCPACEMESQTIIVRTNLGMPRDYEIIDGHGQRVNCINGRVTPVGIGDQYQHREFGTGMVTWINTNNKAKYPIKMHFHDKHVFCYFNIFGMQFKDQEHPLIDLPYIRIKPPYGNKDALLLPTKEIKDELFDNAMTGYIHDKWDRRFIKLAQHVAQWSKDPSTKVGAVIVDSNNRIVSLGFNGYPQHIPDDDLHDREKKYAKVLHAEMNAMLFAQRNLEGCTIYVWPMPPCSQCASAIIQSGIGRVGTIEATADMYERWGDKIKLTEEMFESACVELEYLDKHAK